MNLALRIFLFSYATALAAVSAGLYFQHNNDSFWPITGLIALVYVVEAINGQLEIMRRNSGGYFHSESILKLKLGLAISSLEQGKWKSMARNVACVLHQFNAMFQSRFEAAA